MKKSTSEVIAKLVVDVMPWRTVSFAVFTVLCDGAQVTYSSLPNRSQIKAELDARFKPACVSFSLSGSEGATVNIDFDADDNGAYDHPAEYNAFFNASLPHGWFQVLFVSKLAEGTQQVYGMHPQGTRWVCVGANSWNPPLPEPYMDSEDATGASKVIVRVVAHEIGHALGLSLRNDDGKFHDGGSYPIGTVPLMRSGGKGPNGRWMRHEDWWQANFRAGQAIQ